MSSAFFERPILNSPYEYPRRHWELDSSGQPTGRVDETRRLAEFITPIPKPKKRKPSAKQTEMVFEEAPGPLACITIFPPPLSCELASGRTLMAFDLGGGVDVVGGRAHLRPA